MSYPNTLRGFLWIGLLFVPYVVCPAQAETLKTSVHRTENARSGLGVERNDAEAKVLRNGLGATFVATSGGLGVRWNYHRKLNSIFLTGLGLEVISYRASRVLQKLNVANDPDIDRVTVLSIPLGFRGSFGFLSRVVPHLEVGIGPYIRFDPQKQRERFYSGLPDLTRSDPDVISHNGTPAFGHITPDRTKSDASNIASDINLLLDLLQQRPKTSFALGAFVGGGFDVLVGKNLDVAITVNGYHHYVRFSENAFQPGDFSGFVVSVGLVKYF